MHAQDQQPEASPQAWVLPAWEKHRAWVPALLLAHKPRWADVDDLLQEVALQVIRKAHEVREPEAFPGWLRTVAINVARVAARKGPQSGWRGIRAALGLGSASLPEPADQRDAASQSLALTEHARRILDIAQELEDEYREPLLLKAVHGMSYREISAVMNLPETTIETRVTRGRKKLRELLERSREVETKLHAAMQH